MASLEELESLQKKSAWRPNFGILEEQNCQHCVIKQVKGLTINGSRARSVHHKYIFLGGSHCHIFTFHAENNSFHTRAAQERQVTRTGRDHDVPLSLNVTSRRRRISQRSHWPLTTCRDTKDTLTFREGVCPIPLRGPSTVRFIYDLCRVIKLRGASKECTAFTCEDVRLACGSYKKLTKRAKVIFEVIGKVVTLAG